MNSSARQRGRVKVYHRTADAESILRGGFRDGEGTYMTTSWHVGVFVSDEPLDINEGANGDYVLAIDVAEDLIADYEWVEEHKPYREWCVPARILNESGSVRLLSDDEVLAAEDAAREARQLGRGSRSGRSASEAGRVPQAGHGRTGR